MGNHFSCEEKQILKYNAKINQFFFMNREIATNFEAIKLG